MLTDDEHARRHSAVEEELAQLLEQTFPDEGLCRAVTLISLLYNEFMALEDADDVADVADALSDMLMRRAHSDLSLFAPMGNA